MSTTQTDIPKQFTNLTGMGKLIEVFKPKASKGFLTIIAVVLFLTFGGFFASAIYQAFDMLSRNYYGPIILKTISPMLTAAVIAFLLTLLVIWQLYANSKKALAVYENGFAHSDRKGVKTWKWEQIDSVTANIVRHYTNGIYTGTTHTYTLINSAGEKLVINDAFKNAENFYTHLQNYSLQLRYQRLADLYNQGRQLTFGPVLIGKQNGLQIGKKSFAWDQVDQVSIDKGVLSVKKKDGGWFSGATATSGSIPNLHVLLSIINQVIGLNTGK
jgi:hypothetical protein